MPEQRVTKPPPALKTYFAPVIRAGPTPMAIIYPKSRAAEQPTPRGQPMLRLIPETQKPLTINQPIVVIHASDSKYVFYQPIAEQYVRWGSRMQ